MHTAHMMLRARWRNCFLLVLAAASVVAIALPGSAAATGIDVAYCGQAHHGSYEWTVTTVLSVSEDSAPDVSCASAKAIVIAIDGGKGAADKRVRDAGTGGTLLDHGKWACSIQSGYKGGAESTFMARAVHGTPTWISCADGKDVGGNVDTITYSYGVRHLL
jgi:hypothetical protein